MNAVLWLVITFVFCSATHDPDCPEVCVLNDVQCVTRGAFDVYKLVIAGLNGSLKPMDPLYIEAIGGKNGSTRYSLFNIVLNGLKNCTVTRLRLNVTSEDYKHYIHCTTLNSTFNYETRNESGQINPFDKVIVTAYDYSILNVGVYGVFVKGTDNQPHFFIQSVHTGVYPKGKLNIRSYCDADGQKPNEGSNREVTAEFLLSLVVKRAMKTLIDGVDFFCRKNLMGVVLPESNVSPSEPVCSNIPLPNINIKIEM